MELANVIPLEIKAPERTAVATVRQRFNIQPFTNKRTDSQSWRVTGTRRDGTRIRENFADEKAAQCRQVELMTEHLARQTDTAIRSTKLTDAQIRLAEAAFIRLDNDAELLPAIEHWLKHGKQHTVAESPRLDDAFNQFKTWLETSTLRVRTRGNLRARINVFVNSIGNLRVCDVTPEVIDGYLDKRQVAANSKDNDRRAVSRFFSWCMDRKRRWMTVNPCKAVKVEKPGNGQPPAILSLDECRKLLEAAQKFKRGRLAPYVAVSLFGGLRPFEAARLDWDHVNLADREIRIDVWMTKTKRPRTVAICDTLRAWFKRYEGKAFYPANWRKDFDALKQAIGYGGRHDSEDELKPWPDDVLRHTACSHYFRKAGSYGETAEQFGNSESIIKKHYQARVSTAESKAFYAMLPKKASKPKKGSKK